MLFKILRKSKFLLFRLCDIGLYVAISKMFYMVILKKHTKYPEEIIKLENEFCRALGSDFCFSTASGTTAYESILAGIGAELNDGIFVPECTFHSIQMTTLLHGLKPVYLKRDESLNISLPDDCPQHAKFFLLTHIFGHSANLHAVISFCQKHK